MSLNLTPFSRSRGTPRTANPLSVSSSAEQIIEARFKRDNKEQRDRERERDLERARDKRGIHVVSQTIVKEDERREGEEVGEHREGLSGESRCEISA